MRRFRHVLREFTGSRGAAFKAVPGCLGPAGCTARSKESCGGARPQQPKIKVYLKPADYHTPVKAATRDRLPVLVCWDGQNEIPPPRWLTQQKSSFSKVGKLEAQGQGAGAFGFSGDLSSACRQTAALSLSSHGLSPRHRRCCSVSCNLVLVHQSDPRAHPNGLALTPSSQRLRLQIQSHSEVLGVRTSHTNLGADTSGPITLPKCSLPTAQGLLSS